MADLKKVKNMTSHKDSKYTRQTNTTKGYNTAGLRLFTLFVMQSDVCVTSKPANTPNERTKKLIMFPITANDYNLYTCIFMSSVLKKTGNNACALSVVPD